MYPFSGPLPQGLAAVQWIDDVVSIIPFELLRPVALPTVLGTLITDGSIRDYCQRRSFSEHANPTGVIVSLISAALGCVN